MADLSSSRLESYLLLARSTKGAAAAKIIVDATAAPGVYVFSELLDLPNIQELSTDSSYDSHHRLLRLFAYGTLADYETNSSSFPSLSSGHILKLKQLTLVSLALQQRSLPYDQLLTTLKIESIRQLEDLIIDSIYSGLLGGKMHHHEKVLHVDWAAGRDVEERGLLNVQAGLQNWCKTAESLLSALDSEIDHVRRTQAHESQRRAEYRNNRDQYYYTIATELSKNKSRSGGWNMDGSSKGLGAGASAGKGGLPAGTGIYNNPPMHNEALFAAAGGGRGGVGSRVSLTRNISSSDEPEANRQSKRARD